MPITPSNAKTTAPSKALINYAMEYYDDERLLSCKLFEYIYEGLIKGETCIVVSRPSLLIMLQKMLRASDVCVASVLASGQYVAFDAEEVINTCVLGRELDLVELKQAIGRIVYEPFASHQCIRVFGEVVEASHLRHNRTTAMKIETIWAGLHARYGFSLFNAYKIIAQAPECEPSLRIHHART